MFKLKQALLIALSLATVMFAGREATAATCPPAPVAGDRIFTVLPGASCFAYGAGNIDNDATFAALISAQGYVLLDKSDDGTSGALPGLLTLDPPNTGTSGTYAVGATLLYNSFILGLKSGEGQADPDWAAFLLTALSGTWSITNPGPGEQALSHGNLYGKLLPDEGPSPVPLPGAVWLMGTILAGGAGFGAWRRRRQATAQG